MERKTFAESMKKLGPVGIAYDFDDTLCDNTPDKSNPMSNLHNVARRAAFMSYAELHGGEFSQLAEVTDEECFNCFVNSPEHTIAGAFYTLLKPRGLIDGDIDRNHPIIRELTQLKDEAYAVTMAKFGKPIEGSIDFVRDFAAMYGLEDKNAIASTGSIRDIKVFLDKFDLTYLFPDERIIDIARVLRPKPAPEAFNTAFRELKLHDSLRRFVLSLEDDPRGMMSARKAGLYVIAITTRYDRAFLEKVPARPDMIVNSFDELRYNLGLAA